LSIACLFHQIYIFWLIPMLIFDLRSTKEIRGWIVSGAAVIGTYAMAAFIFNKKILSIVFQDVENGYINNTFSIKNLFIGLVNTLRSFIEIHGRIVPLIEENAWAMLLLGISLVFLIIGTWKCFQQLKSVKLSVRNVLKTIVSLPYFWILKLTLLFAFWSNGNAEYMVSVPFLIIFIAIIRFNINSVFYIQNLILLGLGLLIWNNTAYTLPALNSNIQINTASKVQLIKNLKLKKETNIDTSENPSSDSFIFISREAAALYNCLEYFNLINIQAKSIPVLLIFPDDSTSISIHRDLPIYTDLNSENSLNRARLVYQLPKNLLLGDSIIQKSSTLENYKISRVLRVQH